MCSNKISSNNGNNSLWCACLGHQEAVQHSYGDTNEEDFHIYSQ